MASTRSRPDANVAFHTNRLRITVLGCEEYTIEEMHTECCADYELLEQSHTYIQWLFPIDDASAFNARAHILTREAADAISKNVFCSLRLVYSFAMMLRFYGYTLDPFTVSVTPDEKIHAARIVELNRSTHNWLRITRILRCMTLCGLREYAASFLTALETDVQVTTLLNKAASSCEQHWKPALTESQGWPTTNCGDRLFRAGSSEPRVIARFLSALLLKENVPAAGKYAFRRLLRAEFPLDIQCDHLDASPWIIIGIHSHKKMFGMVPAKAKVNVVNPRNMRVKTVALSRIYKARTRPQRVPVERWFVDGMTHSDGLAFYAAIRDSCVNEGGVSDWVSVWMRKQVKSVSE